MDIKILVQKIIAEESGMEIDDVSYDEDFKNFNLDSLSLVSISFELESQIKREINPTIFFEFNTINKLAQWVESQN